MQTAGVGGAYPRHHYSQQQVASALKRRWSEGLENPDVPDRLFARVGVKGRYLAQPIELEESMDRRRRPSGRYSILATIGLGSCAELVLLH